MIKSNLGKTERVIRLALALVLITWVLSRNTFGVADSLAVVASLALIWNSVYARCYLWSWMGLSTKCNSQCTMQGEDRPTSSRS
ncbi:MAG: DUF2892 domain-containing protein [Congregibacter sp.]